MKMMSCKSAKLRTKNSLICEYFCIILKTCFFYLCSKARLLFLVEKELVLF